MDKFSYIYPQIENESQILYGLNVKTPQSALMTEVRDTVTQNVGDMEYKYQTIDYNNCSNILCEPLNDVPAGSKEIQTHYVQNYQHIQILEQIPQSSNAIHHTHIIQNFDGIATLEARESNKHSFEVYIQPPDNIFDANEVKVLEIDQLKDVDLQRSYAMQPDPIIHYTEYSQPIKKRRRIVQINDDESDEDPVRDEILKSISPQPPEEHQLPIGQESENETPKPKSKKVITKILKERQARALLQSAVIIPAVDIKRKKKRVLVSDDDDDDICKDLNDIGLAGNIQNNELLHRQNIILVTENSIDTQRQNHIEKIVPIENTILPQGTNYVFVQNENNEGNSVNISKITPQYFINVESELHPQESYNVEYTIDNQNYTIKADNFTLKTENAEQTLAQIQIGDILTSEGQITKSVHHMMFNEEYMNIQQVEETEQENNQARDSGNSTDSMSANVVQSIPE